MKFRTAYGERHRVQFATEGGSLTHQSMKAECDINNIMRKFEKTGVLEHRNRFEGNYGDFTGIPTDYHEAMNAVIAAGDMFLTLPAKVRRRFQNDPGNFLEFVSDPDNADELVKMGLATARDPEPVLEGDQDISHKKGASEAPSKPPAKPDEKSGKPE